MPYGCNPFCFTRYLYHTTYSGERKEDLKKTEKSIFFLIASPERRRWAAKPLGGVFLCLAGLYKSTFQNFFTWHTAQPQFSHPHNFYPAHGTRASSEKNPEDFCSPFSKNTSEKFDFQPNRNFTDGNFRKVVQRQMDFIFFALPCAICFFFFLLFLPPPPERLQKNKSVLSA